jgi:ubiquinone/menaquinone biosynthesis C-methylase UbiE
MTSLVAPPEHNAGRAFDSIAERYDDIFTHSLIGRAQRQAVWERTRRVFGPGDYVLEVNCGTGEDALFLARHQIVVWACDASEKMIDVARRRLLADAPSSPVQFDVLPIERISELSSCGRLFDGILSDFAGLNCVRDLARAAGDFAGLVKPGGALLLCVSTRVCIWESLWFLSHGKHREAFRRWPGRAHAVLGESVVEVHYPTIKHLRTLFAPWFSLRSTIGIGVTVPPSYMEAFARRHPGLLRSMCNVDRLICSWPLFRVLGDHVLLRLERTRA